MVCVALPLGRFLSTGIVSDEFFGAIGAMVATALLVEMEEASCGKKIVTCQWTLFDRPNEFPYTKAFPAE